jgi:hypothetical protein
MEARLHPDWLAESDRLLGEPELLGWDLAPPPELREPALAAVRARLASLVVPTNPPERQVQGLLAEAGRTLLTPEVRRALRRRLEETAYIFASSGRLAQARRAVAAALDLAGGGRADELPLVRALLIAGFARSLQAESVAGRSAAETFIELAQDGAAAERQGGVSTTPTGLILPR